MMCSIDHELRDLFYLSEKSKELVDWSKTEQQQVHFGQKFSLSCAADLQWIFWALNSGNLGAKTDEI